MIDRTRKSRRMLRVFLLLACCGSSLGPQTFAAFTDVTETTAFATLEQLPIEELGPVTKDVARGGTPAIIDFNGDGWLDVYVTRFGLEDVLIINRNGLFERVNNPLGISTADGGNVPVWADFDNDGDKDMFVAVAEEKQHRFYLNSGGGIFVEVAEERGVDLLSVKDHMGSGAAAGDLNRDGYLDIVVGEWGVQVDATNQYEHYAVYMNKGAAAPGYFTNVTEASGVDMNIGGVISFFAPTISDLDGDGWPDLPIVADYHRSQLFWNNADGSFTNGTVEAGVSIEENGMGTAIGDVNADGLLDWFVTSIRFTGYPGYFGNQLYINQGERTFDSISDEVGVAVGGWGWGCDLFDYDNDGDLDIVMTNGTDNPAGGFQGAFENMAPMILWRNDGDGGFTEVSDEQGVNYVANGAGLVTFDYDKDGDLDILVFHQYSSPILLRNDRINPVSWLRIELEGTVSNRDAIGARVSVQVTEGGPSQLSEYNPSNSYLAQKEPFSHFGLGQGVEVVSKVTIRWPNGGVQVLEDLAANQVHRIVEPDDAPRPPVVSAPPAGGGGYGYGAPVELSVEASGNPAPVFVWEKDGEPIEGATGSTYRIRRMTFSDVGSYRARAINPSGVAESEAVELALDFDPDAHSVARWWNEILTEAVRHDFPYPPFVARNYYHASAAMWDAFWAYEDDGWDRALPVVFAEVVSPINGDEERLAAQEEAISHAVYRVLKHRYKDTIDGDRALAEFRMLMVALGFDPDNGDLIGDTPAAGGNRIGEAVLEMAANDGSGEAEGFPDASGYEPLNEPMIYGERGVEMVNPSHWQPIHLATSVTKNGIVVGEELQEFLTPSWGSVKPFSFEQRTDGEPLIDPGPPPRFGGDTHAQFVSDAVELIRFSSLLDNSSDTRVDASLTSSLNNAFATQTGRGREVNPVTGESYPENTVKQSDFWRVVAEFWSDGPGVEGPPGVWNMLHNEASDDPLFERRLGGVGPELSALAWDVHAYLAINGALHDAAIACWGVKRKYDSARPISFVRYLGGLGQSSEPSGPSYNEFGLPIVDGMIEVVTQESSAPGERHEALADSVGAVAVRSWRGPTTATSGGVDWMLAEEWKPYHLATFPTPNFAGYVSGHSVFSRAGAEVMTLLTGSPYFPGGFKEFTFEKNGFLRVEEGPSETLSIHCATYYDASDLTGLARLVCGVHPAADDLPGRMVGSEVGVSAFLQMIEMRSGASNAKRLAGVSAQYELAPGGDASFATFELMGDPARPLPMRFVTDRDPPGEDTGNGILTTIAGSGSSGAGRSEAHTRVTGVKARSVEVRGPVGAGARISAEVSIEGEEVLGMLARGNGAPAGSGSISVYRLAGDVATLLVRGGDWREGELASVAHSLAEEVGLPLKDGDAGECALSVWLGLGRYRIEFECAQTATGNGQLRIEFLEQ